MRVLLLNNPKSGRGTGAEIAAQLAGALRNDGHTVTPLAAGPDLAPEAFRAALCDSDLLVVAGGDGTLHHALPAIIESGIAFYHFPLGTENLFAREFGMDRRPETLIAAIRKNQIVTCDAAACDGRPFSLMIGVGFDACVVERLAAGRNGGTTRGTYVRLAALELLSPRLPRLTVRADDRIIVDGPRGMLVVANCRQYAAGLNPARDADMGDGLLDVVFYPHATSAGLLWWLGATAAGAHLGMNGIVTARGARVRVEAEQATPMQIDGEAAGSMASLHGIGKFGFEARALPGALRVLKP